VCGEHCLRGALGAALRQGGLEALRMRDLPGTRPKLDDGRQRRLVEILLEGHRARGKSVDL